MPRTTFDQQNKAKSNRLDYPVLKLTKGEHARAVVMEVNPITEYVHQIEAPVLDDLGKPVMETRNYGKTTREVMSKSYIGKHKCFGRFDVLREKGIDPEECPTCKAAKQGEGIEPPAQYFVAHVFQYATKPGGFQAQEPLSGKLVAWKLSSKRWNELVDLCVEHGKDDKPIDIRALDLLLGPCENENWQKYDIKAGAQCRWVQDDDSKRYVAEVFKNNQAEDLTPLIAPEVSLESARDDVRMVQAKYDVMNGSTPVSASPAEEAGVSQAVDDILGEVLGGQPAKEQVASDALDATLRLDEPDTSRDSQVQPGTAAPEPTPPPPAPEPPSSGSDVADFDKIMDSLNI